MASEHQLLVLLSGDGKRFIFRPCEGMREVAGLGVIDTDRLGALDLPTRITVAGKDYLLAAAALPDILACLKRGAQIITAKDAAQIVMGLGIGPGGQVLEVGTGSAHLTAVLAHSVGREGRIVTYESNPKHAKLAAANLRAAAMDEIVELREADAGTCADKDAYDAAVMDMPEPWSIIGPVTRALVTGGRLCAYVPTMNQAEAAVRSMREAGYSDVHVVENLQREIVVGPGGTRPSFDMLGHTGYLCFGRKTGL